MSCWKLEALGVKLRVGQTILIPGEKKSPLNVFGFSSGWVLLQQRRRVGCCRLFFSQRSEVWLSLASDGCFHCHPNTAPALICMRVRVMRPDRRRCVCVCFLNVCDEVQSECVSTQPFPSSYSLILKSNPPNPPPHPFFFFIPPPSLFQFPSRLPVLTLPQIQLLLNVATYCCHAD